MSLYGCQNRWKTKVRKSVNNLTTAAIPIPKVGYGYYEYSSKPTSQTTRPKYRSNLDKPRGVHDFYNVMWDPHVYRGRTYKTFQEVERERSKVLTESKRWQNQPKRSRRKLGFINIPKTPPQAPIGNYLLNLDKYLIEDVGENGRSDISEQTDDINRKKSIKSEIPSKIGFDVATEILPGEMFTFDEEVEPIVGVMGDKIIEQSLRENEEEEELMALHEAQNAYEERRRLDILRMKRLEERNQEIWKLNEEIMKIKEIKQHKAVAVEKKIGARMFAKSYLKLILPQVLESLGAEGYFETIDVAYVTQNVTPWINQEVKTELAQQLLAGGILDDMLESLSLTRETDNGRTHLKTETNNGEILGEG